MRKALLLTLALLMCICFLSACTIDWSGNQGTITGKLTALSAPEITQVKDDVVYWNSVSNADAYIVSINNKEARTTELFYPISALIDDSCEVTIKVKAKGNGILYGDSEWGAIMTVSYIAQGSPVPTPTPAEKLSAPANLRVENDVIMWDEVENAETYTVVINNDYDNERVTKSLICNVSDMTDKSGNLSIKVKANATDTHKASDWSETLEYAYVARYTDEEKIALFESIGIGRGYNFYEDPYIETGDCTKDLIFDLSLLLAYGKPNETSNSQSYGTVEYYSKLEEFRNKAVIEVGYSDNGTVNILGKVKATVENNYSLESEKELSKYSYINNYYYTWNQECKNYSVSNFTYGVDDIVKCLSDQFLAIINSNEKSDEEKCAELYSLYGTHALLGVKMGATFTANYQIRTTKSSLNDDIIQAFSTKGDVSVLKDLVNASVSLGLSVNNENSEHKEDTYGKLNAAFYGGPAAVTFTLENIDTVVPEWAAGVTENNYASIGITENGAISIVTILEKLFGEGDESLGTKYQKYLDAKYTELWEEIKGMYPEYVHEEVLGSEKNPILIKNADDLTKLTTYNGENIHFKLDAENAEIDLANVDFDPREEFLGILDGNYHIIKNWTRSSTVDTATAYGLFCINRGVIKNLVLENFDITVKSSGKEQISIGALVGDNYGTIENCYVKNLKLNVSKSFVGGPVTTDYLNIFAGGIVGFNRSTTENSANKEQRVPGVVKNCHVEASEIKCTTKYVVTIIVRDKQWAKAGGITGINDGDIIACYANNNVITANANLSLFEGNNGVAAAGGIAGYNRASGIISYSFAHSNTLSTAGSGKMDYQGQLCGQQYGELNHCRYLLSDKIYVDDDEHKEDDTKSVNSVVSVTTNSDFNTYGWHLVGENEVSPFNAPQSAE